MNITEIMEKLAARRPIFHSEADFQFELAWEIKLAIPNAKIRMEVPFYEIPPDKNMHIDIMVIINEKKIGIELKYKKKASILNHEGEKFSLKSTKQTNSRKSFRRDADRLSKLYEKNEIQEWYTILLHNREAYSHKNTSYGIYGFKYEMEKGNKELMVLEAI